MFLMANVVIFDFKVFKRTILVAENLLARVGGARTKIFDNIGVERVGEVWFEILFRTPSSR